MSQWTLSEKTVERNKEGMFRADESSVFLESNSGHCGLIEENIETVKVRIAIVEI